MSILMNPEKINPSVRDLVSPGRAQAAGLTGASFPLRPSRREFEPLEEAVADSEAPEQRTQTQVEAPDAGEPQFPYDDREFRHGRSRG